MVERVEAGEPVAEVTRQVGVSRQTASKWLARARRGEPMSDRPSRPRGLARGLGQRGLEGGRPRGLRRPLQLGQAAQRLRGPAFDVTDLRRKQRLGT